MPNAARFSQMPRLLGLCLAPPAGSDSEAYEALNRVLPIVITVALHVHSESYRVREGHDVGVAPVSVES